MGPLLDGMTKYIHIRQLALYILRMTNPDRGFSSMSEGKKNKNKISWAAGVGGKKNKAGKIRRI